MFGGVVPAELFAFAVEDVAGCVSLLSSFICCEKLVSWFSGLLWPFAKTGVLPDCGTGTPTFCQSGIFVGDSVLARVPGDKFLAAAGFLPRMGFLQREGF